MARLEDKIAEIPDAGLRQAIGDEVSKLKKRTRFGLVFEEHQPEVVPVFGKRVKRGERVSKKNGTLPVVSVQIVQRPSLNLGCIDNSYTRAYDACICCVFAEGENYA